MSKQITISTFEKIDSLLQTSGFLFGEIGSCCGVSVTVVMQIARGKHYHQADPDEQARRDKCASDCKPPYMPPYMPTPAEISTACERIRAGWCPRLIRQWGSAGSTDLFDIGELITDADPVVTNGDHWVGQSFPHGGK